MNQLTEAAGFHDNKSEVNIPEQDGFGALPPDVAWHHVQSGGAVLLDVRTVEERAYVGRVPGSVHVAWATGTAMNRNPHFVRQVQQHIPDKDHEIVVLCRSGKRSALAAEALTKAGYTHVLNITEGFEGNLDTTGHRGAIDGWRFRGLPWEQD